MEVRTKGIIVLVVYFILFWVFALGSLEFIKSTVSKFQAPSGTMVRRTQDLASELLTTQSMHDPLFFIVNNKNRSQAVVWPGMSVEHAPLCRLGSFLHSLMLDPKRYNTPEMYSVKWYCHYIQFPTFARNLVSADNTTGLIAVDLHGSLLGGAADGSGGPFPVINAVKHYLVTSNLTEAIDVKSTSVVEVFQDLKDGLLGDLLKIDGVAVPLAVISLILCLRSGRMAFIPLPSILLAVTLTFAIMYPIALHYPVSSFAPEFVMGGLLALTIDFSLFLGSRFAERVALARLAGKDIEDPAVRWAIVWDTTVLTSHNIVVSGLAVAISLGMLLIVPISTVATIGGAYALGAIVTIFVALTFQPAMFLVFFDFFSHDPCVAKIFSASPRLRKAFGDDLEDANFDDEDNNDGEQTKSETSLANSSGAAHQQTGGDNNDKKISDLTVQEQAEVSRQASSNSTHPNLSGTPLLDAASGVAAQQNRINNNNNGQRGAPSLNKMFHQKDLIQYRSSDVPNNTNNSSITPTGSDARFAGDGEQHNVQAGGSGRKNQSYGEAIISSHADDVARRAQNRSVWFRLGRWVIQYPVWTLLIIGALAAPFAYLTFQFEITFDMYLQVPKSSPHVATLFEVTNDIGSGALSTPFYITVDTGKKDGFARYETFPVSSNKSITTIVFNATIFEKFQKLVHHAQRVLDQPLSTLSSVVSFPHVPANFSTVEAEALLLCAESEIHIPEFNGCFEYQLLYNHTLDATRRLAMILIAPKYNPFGIHAYDYVASIERAVKTFDSDGLFEVGFFGASGVSYAILHKMNELLPLQLGLMFALVFIVMFTVFRSVFVALLMIATVALPVAVALGVGVLFFQIHPFNTIWPVTCNAYAWLVPTFALTLCVALGLDYCVFIMTRIVEYKTLGFTNDAAVNKAIWKSSRTISWAGIIMLFSFGGMMFSNVMMMIQFGFVASVSVIVDTFVVRPMVVPALMSIVPDGVVWWPRTFDVPATRDVNDMTEVNYDAENGDGSSVGKKVVDGDEKVLINNNEQQYYGTSTV